jgi:hypothetical protein
MSTTKSSERRSLVSFCYSTREKNGGPSIDCVVTSFAALALQLGLRIVFGVLSSSEVMTMCVPSCRGIL